jgi:hypothetical protein
VQVPLDGVVLERPLGIIHRRDRKLNESAEQFIALLQSQSRPAAVGATVPIEASPSNGVALERMTATVSG